MKRIAGIYKQCHVTGHIYMLTSFVIDWRRRHIYMDITAGGKVSHSALRP